MMEGRGPRVEGLCSCQGADQEGFLQQVTFKQGPEQGELGSLADTRAEVPGREGQRQAQEVEDPGVCGWEEGRGGGALWDKK